MSFVRSRGIWFAWSDCTAASLQSKRQHVSTKPVSTADNKAPPWMYFEEKTAETSPQLKGWKLPVPWSWSSVMYVRSRNSVRRWMQVGSAGKTEMEGVVYIILSCFHQARSSWQNGTGLTWANLQRIHSLPSYLKPSPNHLWNLQTVEKSKFLVARANFTKCDKHTTNRLQLSSQLSLYI